MAFFGPVFTRLYRLYVWKRRFYGQSFYCFYASSIL